VLQPKTYPGKYRRSFSIRQFAAEEEVCFRVQRVVDNNTDYIFHHQLKSILRNEKRKGSYTLLHVSDKYFVQKHFSLIIDPIRDEFKTMRGEKICRQVKFPCVNNLALEIIG